MTRETVLFVPKYLARVTPERIPGLQADFTCGNCASIAANGRDCGRDDSPADLMSCVDVGVVFKK